MLVVDKEAIWVLLDGNEPSKHQLISPHCFLVKQRP